MIPKSPNAVVCDPFCFFGIGNEVFNLLLEIREISLHFHEILVGAISDEEIMVVLDPLHFVNDNNRAANLSIL